MARFGKHGLALMLLAALLLAACAKPGSHPPLRDDTQNIDRPDRGMTKSGSM